jgi:hypothetical protein
LGPDGSIVACFSLQEQPESQPSIRICVQATNGAFGSSFIVVPEVAKNVIEVPVLSAAGIAAATASSNTTCSKKRAKQLPISTGTCVDNALAKKRLKKSSISPAEQAVERLNLITDNAIKKLSDAPSAAVKIANRLRDVMISSLDVSSSTESSKTNLADIIRRELASWTSSKKSVVRVVNAFDIECSISVDAKINNDTFDALCEKASIAFVEIAAVKI